MRKLISTFNYFFIAQNFAERIIQIGIAAIKTHKKYFEMQNFAHFNAIKKLVTKVYFAFVSINLKLIGDELWKFWFVFIINLKLEVILIIYELD